MSAFSKWTHLKKGDTIDIVAPGSGVSAQTLNHIVTFLEDLGLRPRVPLDLLGSEVLSSNSDEVRAKHLITALHDVHSKAIWCVKNGYGAGRLASTLAKINKPLRPKLFIGGADATAIHLYLNHAWGWSTVYGPTLDRVVSKKISEKSLEELFYVVRGKLPTVNFDGLRALNESAKVPSAISAPLTGGQLSKISLTIGTTWSRNPKGFILFVDQAGSRAHEIDGFLDHMNQANYFSNAKAIIFGSIAGCSEPDGKTIWLPIIERFAASVSIPVLSGVENMNASTVRVMPFATEAELTTGAKGRLSIPTGGNGEGTSTSINVA